ncbi:glycoside hydrolase family 3 N-terminal domain-containing protein [Paenibacillus paeoniae]|uniref:beta-glucosidase n=1 Tax=Paenibacillus paeoniae TaxID=2292705 RepID=A0A371PFT2_9BACL|nr:glycoside hydrolase family 3 N-terminal domain-containing protein [Paenibacillus paeoniae]REK74734.1 protein GluA [Paenibacillus paeoniae]
MGRKVRKLLSSFLAFTLVTGLFAAAGAPSAEAAVGLPVYLNPAKSVDERAKDLLDRMTIEERAGQMIQPEKSNITPQEVKQYFIGSVLSGGGSFPNNRQADSTEAKWRELTDSLQDGALSTRLGIPLLYGVDAVHGHNNVIGATLFPHNIGLGAANNLDLMRQIGQATAKEMRATGTNWDFAPTIAAPQDIRWGRTYEGFSSDPNRTGKLGAAFIEGLQGKTDAERRNPLRAVGTAKHFIGEGFTDNGRNQGDITGYTEEQLLAHDLQMYKEAIAAGVQTVMASYHSIAGLKMHANKRLLTDVLKDELGFKGFVISDYNAIQQINRDQDGNPVSGLKNQVRVSVNAGVDMFMLTGDWRSALNHLIALVNEGAVTEERLDDAVLRILKVKIASGLFEYPKADKDLAGSVGAAAHRNIARQAVAESLVLLKNDKVGNEPILSQLPKMNKLYLAGKSADDIGIQSGGWSITWQGATGKITEGTTILKGFQDAVAGTSKTVTYNRHGRGAAGHDVAIVVIGETPYAESDGDRTALDLDVVDRETLLNIRKSDPNIPIVVVLVSGRPMTISEHLSDWQGLVAAWLPGTEGRGVADVLLGSRDFKGTNPIEWPFYVNANYPLTANSDNLLFDVGYGLKRGVETPELPVAPALPQPHAEKIPGKIEAEAFAAKSNGLNTQVAEDEGDGLNIGWTSAGAWLDYRVNVEEAGTYKAAFRYAGNGGATGIRVKRDDGVTAGTLNVGSTGGWQSWATAEVEDIVLPKSGVQTLRLEFIAGDMNFNWVTFTRTGDVPADGGGNGGGTDPVGNEGTGDVIVAGGVETWVSSERDAADRKWYYDDRYQPGDKKLEPGANLDLRLPDSGDVTAITLDPDKTYQSMLGIGSSMEESTIYNLVKMSPEKQKELLVKLVHPEDGIGMSLIRLTIGTSDFTAQKFYSYNDMPPGQTDVNLDNFSIQKDIELGIIPTVKKIQEINPDIQFFASPWSPPGWMKTTDSMIRGQVKEEYLPLVAKYYEKFLEAYAGHGIYFEGMTLQNEPLLEIDYPSTAMSWQQTSRLAKLLRDRLDANSNPRIQSVKLWMFDHNPGDTMAFPALVLGDEVEGAYDAVEGTAFHDYGGELSMMSVLQEMFPEKSVYLTERAVWGTTGADRIAQYFRNYAKSYNSWVTMLDSDIATHQWVGIPDPTPIIQDSSNPDNYWILPEYYLMGHYTKFVKPGYVRIDSNYGSASTVTNVAFASPDGKEIVTVVINRTADPQPFKILIDGLQMNATLPAKSVATYRFDRAQALQPKTAVAASAFAAAEGQYVVQGDSIGGFSETDQATFRYVTEVKEGGTYYADIEYIGSPQEAELQIGTGEVIALVQDTGGSAAKVRSLIDLQVGKQLLTLNASGSGYSIRSISLSAADSGITVLPGMIEGSRYSNAYGVVAQGTSIVGGDQDDWVQYTVDASAAGIYNVTYQYAAPESGGELNVIVNDEEGFVVSLPSTGGTVGRATGTITLEDGINQIRLEVTGTVDRLDFIAIGAALVPEQQAIVEGSEAGSKITVHLLNGTFAPELAPSNWSVVGLDGITVAGVERDNDTTAVVTLGGAAVEDYDSDRRALLFVTSEEIDGAVSGASLTASILFTAVNDPESISLSPAHVAYDVEGKEIVLNINGGKLLADHVDAITVSGPAVTRGGVSLASAQWVSAAQVKLTLAWNGTTYYDDLQLNVHVPVAAYGDSAGGSELTAHTLLTGTVNVTDPIGLLDLNALDQFHQMKGLTVSGSGTTSRFSGIDAGDYVEYLVDVPEDGRYVALLTVTSNSQAYNGIIWHTNGGADKKAVTVPHLYNQVVQMRTELELSKGEQRIRLAAGAGNYELRGIKFEKLTVPATDAANGPLKVEAETYTSASSAAVQTNNPGTATEFRNIGFTVAGGHVDYAVNIGEAGYYKVVYRYATPQSGVRMTIGNEEGAPYGSVPFGSTGGWNNYQEVSHVVQLPEGVQTLRLNFGGEGANLDWFTLEPSEPVEEVIGGTVALTKASLKVGVYNGSRSVTLSSATEGAEIYYTLDGSLPSKDNGVKYSRAITLSELTVIRAIAVKEGMEDSFVAPFTYQISRSSGGGEVITPPVTEEPEVVDGKEITAPVPVVDEATGMATTAITAKSLEDALSGGTSGTVQRITIRVPQADGAKGYEVELPTDSISHSNLDYYLVIVTPSGTIELPSHMVSKDAVADAKKLSIIIRDADIARFSDELKAQIGTRPVVELLLAVDGVPIAWSNPDAPVQVSVPYQPTNQENNNELLTIWYIDNQGAVHAVPSGKYSASSKAVTFTTLHFSSFAVVYVEKSFGDLQRYDWAKREIEVMASKGVINGISEQAYAPERQVKRADFLLLLARALGWEAKANVNGMIGFSDVSEDDYYYDAVLAAQALGIVTGRADGTFDPGASITRQEMMAMTARALAVSGKSLKGGDASLLDGFSDLKELASYAKESASILLANDIVKGSDGKLNPLGHTTRAEAAVIVYRIYNK